MPRGGAGTGVNGAGGTVYAPASGSPDALQMGRILFSNFLPQSVPRGGARTGVIDAGGTIYVPASGSPYAIFKKTEKEFETNMPANGK